MAIVVFDPEVFRKRHAGFTDEEKYTDEALEFCFTQAVEMVGNDDDSIIPYEPEESPKELAREIVLDLLTCHIATQNILWEDTQAGPLGNAAEGSVNAGFQSLADTSNPAWWMSTKCGAQAWQIIKRYGSGVLYFGVEHLYFGG